jgi:hypothetical protein
MIFYDNGIRNAIIANFSQLDPEQMWVHYGKIIFLRNV